MLEDQGLSFGGLFGALVGVRVLVGAMVAVEDGAGLFVGVGVWLGAGVLVKTTVGVATGVSGVPLWRGRLRVDGVGVTRRTTEPLDGAVTPAWAPPAWALPAWARGVAVGVRVGVLVGATGRGVAAGRVGVALRRWGVGVSITPLNGRAGERGVATGVGFGAAPAGAPPALTAPATTTTASR